jgi:CDP-glucose 4,6-dehydratase
MNSFWSNKSALILGGNGYLGIEMIQRLLQKGVLVTSLDRGQEKSLYSQTIEGDFEYLCQDLSDFEELKNTLKRNKFDICFNLAGFSNIAKARENPIEAYKANVQTVCNLLEAFRVSGHFPYTIIASSNHIYGRQSKYPTPESALLNSKEIYGVTKGCGDMLARAYATTYNAPISVARITNTYGGHEPFRSHLIPYFITEVQKNLAPMIKGNPFSMKGFLYVSDTINGLLALSENMEREELWGEAFNFYPDSNMSVLDVVKTILKVMGRQDLSIEINKNNSKDIGENIEFLSNSLAKSKLGWAQEVPLEKGISLSITDYKKTDKL